MHASEKNAKWPQDLSHGGYSHACVAFSIGGSFDVRGKGVYVHKTECIFLSLEATLVFSPTKMTFCLGRQYTNSRMEDVLLIYSHAGVALSTGGSSRRRRPRHRARRVDVETRLCSHPHSRREYRNSHT